MCFDQSNCNINIQEIIIVFIYLAASSALLNSGGGGKTSLAPDHWSCKPDIGMIRMGMRKQTQMLVQVSYIHAYVRYTQNLINGNINIRVYHT